MSQSKAITEDFAAESLNIICEKAIDDAVRTARAVINKAKGTS